jgi:hypothetical protein
MLKYRLSVLISQNVLDIEAREAENESKNVA